MSDKDYICGLILSLVLTLFIAGLSYSIKDRSQIAVKPETMSCINHHYTKIHKYQTISKCLDCGYVTRRSKNRWKNIYSKGG